jgi:predicted metalloprotease
MVSLNPERTSERKRRPRLWAVAAASVVALGVAGTRASELWRDVGRPSPEPPHGRVDAAVSAAEAAELDELIASVVKDVDAMWVRDFKRRVKPYASAEPVLLELPETTDCGPGLALGRPDCFATNKAFIDLSFQRALVARHGDQANGAQAYAIAHELGHHVQRVLGMDTKLASLLEDRQVASHWAYTQIELQADCFAGVWSRRTQLQHLVEPTHIEASLRHASDLGTERRLAERGDGASIGESFTYAIPRRRIYWFAQGYKHGEIDDCDTFAP